MQSHYVKNLLSEYLDRALNPEASKRVEDHLKGCPDCHREARLLKNSWDLLDFFESIAPSPDFEARFWARVQREKGGSSFWEKWLSPNFKPLLTAAVTSIVIGVLTGTVFHRKERAVSVTEQGLAVFTSANGLNSLPGALFRHEGFAPAGSRNEH